MGRRATFLLALGCILLLGLTTVPVDLSVMLAQGDEALAAGRLVEALELYREVASHPRGDAAAALKIAQTQMAIAQGEVDEPTAAYQAARDAWLHLLNIPEYELVARRGLAETYLALGETTAAAEQWEFVFAADPADPSLWYQLAPAHLNKGEWEAAGRAYSAIAGARPEETEAHYLAGVLLVSSPSLARTHLLAARDVPLYEERANKLLLALADLADIADPAYAAGRLGLAYLDINEPAIAERHFQAAVEKEPAYADAWAYLGLAQDQVGEDGRRAIARAIELEPDNPLVRSLMGYHWLRFDQPRLAREQFIAAWQLNPDDPVHMADVASAYQAEGDYTSAEAWYQAAVRGAPDVAMFWILLARFHLDTLNDVVDGGLLAAQKAVALAPEDPAALDTLGWAQFLNGQFDLAETNLLAARQRDPSSAVIPYHLGRLYADLGEWDQAEKAYEQAMALDSSCRTCGVARRGSYAQVAERALNEIGKRQ